MKTSLLFIIQLCCAVAIVACAPVSQNYYEKQGLEPLSTEQLETELTGKTLHLESIDFDALVSFKTKHILKAESISGGDDSGRWFLEGDDTICMEFSSWYFGDKRCYRLIKSIKEENQYIFFTLNGAHSYTATAAPKHNSTTVSGKQKTSPNTSPTVAKSTTETTQHAETATERKQHFIRLAKNCPGCNLSGLDLSGGQLTRANLAGANLSGANLSNAELRQANLVGADLSGAILIRANMPGADLSRADLSDANLSDCNLIRANIEGATTTNTNVTGAHLESIQGTF
ncbi:pentapeptide repeat-containing protein [Desulforhopalus sp. 52FAK]